MQWTDQQLTAVCGNVVLGCAVLLTYTCYRIRQLTVACVLLLLVIGSPAGQELLCRGAELKLLCIVTDSHCVFVVCAVCPCQPCHCSPSFFRRRSVADIWYIICASSQVHSHDSSAQLIRWGSVTDDDVHVLSACDCCTTVQVEQCWKWVSCAMGTAAAAWERQ